MTPTEIADRGDDFYAEHIAPHLPVGEKGKFLMLDILTGEYEIDTDDILAEERLFARQPNALIYQIRIGSATAYHSVSMVCDDQELCHFQS